ncbi:hypothetical protein ACFL3B_00740 [Gemmatimonadota bacterium]
MDYAAGDAVVTAEILAPTLLEPARRLFPAYEVARPGLQRSERVDVSVRWESGVFLVASLDSPDVLCKTEMDAIVVLEFALSRSLAASFVDYVHLHASGAVVDGQAILALGSSGAGKSSLAVAMQTRGFPTLGDDTVFLSSAARAIPFKRLLKVSGVVLSELGVDPTDTILWDPAWPEVWYDPQEGPGWATETPVGVIVLARYDPNARFRLSPIPKTEALNVVVHSVMTTGMPAGEDFDRLVQMVRGASVFQVEFRSAIEAAEVICTLTR